MNEIPKNIVSIHYPDCGKNVKIQNLNSALDVSFIRGRISNSFEDSSDENENETLCI